MDNHLLNIDSEKLHESWFNEKTIDFWRHKRMYLTISPFAKSHKESKWLTIGDGRYGLDAIRLKKLFNLKNIFPTDIAENMLRISKSRGLIDDYKIENAEQLSFSNDTYDVIFCKEAFHHFSRPYIALYEMLRVAKDAVILVEPSERLIHEGVKSKDYLISAFKLLLSKIFGKSYMPYVPKLQPLRNIHEEAGNYLYAVSVRELEKLVHGLDIEGLAYCYFNDYYRIGVEYEEAVSGNSMFQEIQQLIKNADSTCHSYPNFHQPNMVAAVIFKTAPDIHTQNAMIDSGFIFIKKVPNPYL
jgi:ubiquinone/menaquinone biosynthesis C-methylase UbiE